MYAKIDEATSGDRTLIAATAGKKIAVYELFLWNVAEQDLTFKDGSTALTGVFTTYPAKSGLYLPHSGPPHFLLTSGQAFVLNNSGGTQISGWVDYEFLEA